MLANIKLLLGIASADTSKDDVLNAIIAITEDRLKALVGVDTIPSSLSFVVTEISIIRFNRLGSEGMTAESHEGFSTTYASNDADFTPYLSQIKKHTGTGKFRFL